MITLNFDLPILVKTGQVGLPFTAEYFLFQIINLPVIIFTPTSISSLENAVTRECTLGLGPGKASLQFEKYGTKIMMLRKECLLFQKTHTKKIPYLKQHVQ